MIDSKIEMIKSHIKLPAYMQRIKIYTIRGVYWVSQFDDFIIMKIQYRERYAETK